MFEELVSILEEQSSEQAVDQHKGPNIKFWRVVETLEKQKEFYTLGESSGNKVKAVLDQARIVNQSQLNLEVWIDKGDSQGFASKTIFSGRDLRQQLSECLEQAKVSAEKPWMPPAPSNEFVSDPQLCYAALSEDFMSACDQVYSGLAEAIDSTAKGVFNSSELFCAYSENRVKASNGHSSQSRRSRFYTEVCFSSQSGEDSQEFLVTEWAVHPEQLNFRKMCDESSTFAEALLKAEPTPKGEYSVLLHADVLNEVYHDLLSHLNARSKYYQMPFKSIGEDLISGFEGDSFGIKLNPARDWTMSSRRDDGWGKSLPSLILANSNKVLATACSSQMSQYLGFSSSTASGCLDIETDGSAVKDLISTQPTLEILQFSGLFTSSVDLTFSSEIRLARLWQKDGSVTYLKGGSLSGSINDHFKYIKFSDNKVCHNKYERSGSLSYYGPDRALIQGVSVTA